MKVYKFECDSCGSKQYIKTEDGYKCKYCGSHQDIINVEPKVEKPVQQNNVSTVVKVEELTPYGRRHLILLIVCIFFGIYGIHKFMEHKIFSGILYLFTWGLFGIGWFIDVFKHAHLLYQEARRKRN